MKCENNTHLMESDSGNFSPNCSEMPPPPIHGASDASPGRRWSARICDLWLGGFIVGLAHVFLFPPNLGKNILTTLIFPFLYSFFALCLEAIEYCVFGETLGKWAFSVTVLDSNGVKLGRAEYAKRLLGIWIQGLAFCLPFIRLIPQIIQYRRLKKGKRASYDEKAKRRVIQYELGFAKILVCILFALVIICGCIWVYFIPVPTD